ncbi:hypothetical protein GGS26DRAFT_596224 [Hypomontagnella submonticulosa]|nr:hypothetical protein GGS26DRAFT_596224 [Hypomontagnella submonticulosa]
MISYNFLFQLLLLSPALVTARPGFVAYKEKTCNDPLEMWSDGVPIPDNTLRIDHSIKEWHSHAAGHYYDNVTLPAANATGNFDKDAGIQFAYFKVPEPDPGCQYLLMRDSPRGWQILTKLPGIEVLNVNKEGCYYTPLSPNDDLITSFCCGKDDCAIANIDEDQGGAKETISGGSGVAPNCTIKRKYNDRPTRTNGQQFAVTKPQTCEAPPTCTHSISNSRMVSTTISHSQSYSWTTTDGTDIRIDGGPDILRVGATMSYSIAQTWMEDTGTTFTQTNVTATEESDRQEMGTVAFFSFTPEYDCWTGDVSCGEDSDGKEVVLGGVSFCQPVPSNAGGADGVYSMVYIS